MVSSIPQKPTRSTARKKTSGSHHSPANDSHIFTKYVGSLEVKPHQQSHMSLGRYNAEQPAKGFSINISPDPSSPNSVTTQVTSLGNARRYELILRVANYGTEKLQAEIWQI